MKLSTRRVIPLVIVVVSLLYIVFSFSLEQRRMIGDVKGWDPGSRAMPVGVGFLMLGLSIYLSFKEARSGEEEKPLGTGSKKLIILTATLSIIYVLCFRFVGFILSTNILLFTLVYFNYRQDIRWNMVPNFSIGILLSSGFIVLTYSIGRFVTRSLFLMGKRSNIEILTSRVFTSGITLLVVIVIFIVTLLLSKEAIKNEKSKSLCISGFISAGATEFLYIIFKQIFWVSLARGLIFW